MPRKREIDSEILRFLALNGPSYVDEMTKKIGRDENASKGFEGKINPPRYHRPNISQNVNQLLSSGLIRPVRKYRDSSKTFGPMGTHSLFEVYGAEIPARKPNETGKQKEDRLEMTGRVRELPHDIARNRKRKHFWLTLSGIATALQMDVDPKIVWDWAVKENGDFGLFARYTSDLMATTISRDASRWIVSESTLQYWFFEWWKQHDSQRHLT